MTMRDGRDDVLHTSPPLKTSSQSSRPTRDLEGVSYETVDHSSSSINGVRGSNDIFSLTQKAQTQNDVR